MKIKFYFPILFVFNLVLWSCGDNEDDGTIIVEENDRTEQQVIDGALLLEYLNTHYYNSSAFISNPNPKIADLIISELPEDGVLPNPSENTLLIDAVEYRTTDYLDVEYDYYILKLNEGGGNDSPNFPDKIRLNYNGSLEDGDVFDSTSNPTDFELLSLIQGWNRVLPEFNTAENFSVNSDNTVDYFNHGAGVMFLPSGLGYYAGTVAGIPAYSNLIFKFELYQIEQNDHDADGIPSYMEDLSDDFDLINDDTDNDQFPNYLDVDDDGDGTLTRDEVIETTYNEPTRQAILDLPLASNEVLTLIVEEEDGTFTGTTITFPDTNGNGIPNYLDEADSESFDE